MLANHVPETPGDVVHTIVPSARGSAEHVDHQTGEGGEDPVFGNVEWRTLICANKTPSNGPVWPNSREVQVNGQTLVVHDLPLQPCLDYLEAIKPLPDGSLDTHAMNEAACLLVVRALRGRMDVAQAEVDALPTLMSLDAIHTILREGTQLSAPRR